MHRSTLVIPRMCVLTAILLAAPPASAADRDRMQAISPEDGPIALFNGKNLDGLRTWLRDTKEEDPRNIFTVRDGMLHVSGDGLGYIITKNDYRDYHLIVEFKWGKRTWANRNDRARDSGVLFHCHGPDGSFGGTWVPSVEAQIIEGGVGDILVLSGKETEDGESLETSLTAEVTTDRDGETVWKEGGERKPFTGGRINWYGRDPDWADVVDYRGPDDVESPFGQWTRMDVICDGDHVVIEVNGVKVNEASDVFPSFGKILLQTELAEIIFRRWELWPIGEAPTFDAESFGFED